MHEGLGAVCMRGLVLCVLLSDGLPQMGAGPGSTGNAAARSSSTGQWPASTASMGQHTNGSMQGGPRRAVRDT